VRAVSPTLKPEDRISHYRVIGPIGAGGMGEVYAAQDTSLERDVALKILPPELVRDEGRVRRFIQEAKSASSLSHPHIVTIHEIGQAEFDGATVHFIAMELVRGDTLRQLIHGEKALLRTLLRYLAQAADGLAKAHAAGIVHRDLKPDNIMVTKDGFAKVLDFGLAKLTESKISVTDLTDSPTATLHKTGEGVVLGTIGYMSPEQVQGKPVDHRSDIFSFGCILYEAATRRRPFAGDSSVETMHKILKDGPAPIEELNAEAPAELRRLIRRCLTKNPDERHHSMKDIAIELREIVEEYDALSISSSSRGFELGRAGPGDASGGRGRSGRWIGVAAMAVVILGAITAGGWSMFHRMTDRRSAATFQASKMTRLASFEDLRNATLSPDGRFLAYALQKDGKYSLWLRQIATGSDIPILPPQADFAGRGRFSPDGNYLYYGASDPENQGYNALYRVPTLGGQPRKILYDVDSPATFSPDGKQLAFVRNVSRSQESRLVIANVDGTAERTLKVQRRRIVALSWSPDGARIALDSRRSEGGFHSQLIEVSTSDAKETLIGPRYLGIRHSLVWLPDGSGLAITQGAIDGNSQLWFVPYPEGEPRRITNDPNDYGQISVSADSKTLAVTQERESTRLWVAPAAEPGLAKELTSVSASADSLMQVRATPEGSIVYRVPREGTSRIWSLQPGSPPTPLSPEDLHSFGPRIARETGTIVFTATRADGVPHIWKMDLDGGNPVQLTHGGGEAVWDVSPDGKTMLTVKPNEPGLWKSSLEGDSSIKISDSRPNVAKYSPDGRSLLTLDGEDEAGRTRWRFVVRPANGGAPTRKIDLPAGSSVIGARPAGRSVAGWTPSGDALICIREVDGVGNLWNQPLTGGAPKPITDFKSGRISEYDFSPDGKTLFFTRDEVRTDVVLITNFK
jgi:Tol biopolymer transport system component